MEQAWRAGKARVVLAVPIVENFIGSSSELHAALTG
jgi:hypothetical protein